MEITTKELQEKIANGENLIVELWGVWCNPCKMMKPIFEKVANENTSNVGMYTMDVDKNSEMAKSLGVRSIPTTLTFSSGKLTETKVGMLNESQINDLVGNLING
jgi:thioredoxin 1